MTDNQELELTLSKFKPLIMAKRTLQYKKNYVKYIQLNKKEKSEPKSLEMNCLHCKVGISYLLTGKNIGKCKSCGTINIHLNLTNYQQTMLLDRCNQKVYASAPGVGKTTVSALEWYLYAHEFPGSNIVCVAPTVELLKAVGKYELSQYFVQKEDGEDFDDFIIRNDSEWVLKNGTKFNWKTSDKDSKVRGMNLDGTWIIEGNQIKPDVLRQLDTRERSTKNEVYAKDQYDNIIYEEFNGISRPKIIKTNRKTIIETNNDDAEYIRDEYILTSDKVFYTSLVPIDNYMFHHKSKQEIIRDRHTYLIDLFASPNQRTDYIIRALKARSDAQNILTDFFCDMFATTREIIHGWDANIVQDISMFDRRTDFIPYIIVSDFGSTLAFTTMLMVILNPIDKNFYIYDVYYENNLSIEEHAKRMIQFKLKYQKPNFFEVIHCGDNSANKHMGGTRDSLTLSQNYSRLGLKIRTDVSRLKNPKQSIIDVNKLFADKKLFILSRCQPLIDELMNYKKIVNKKGSLAIPSGAKEGKTFDLIDSLYMFSQLVTLPEHKKYHIDQILMDRVIRIQNQENPLVNNPMLFLL